jgi:hypothetical protein
VVFIGTSLSAPQGASSSTNSNGTKASIPAWVETGKHYSVRIKIFPVFEVVSRTAGRWQCL